MPVIDYLVSYGTLALMSLLIWGIPWLCLYSRFPEVPRLVLFLALMGFHLTTLYLSPVSLPIAALPFLFIILGIYLWKGHPLRIKQFLAPLRSWPTLAIFAYCFLLFFFRWEPPGNDPIKWGSLARLIVEYGRVPGDTRPITPLTDLKGASLGIPLQVALFHSWHFVPLERAINFVTCASLAAFVFALAEAMKLWFKENIAILAALTCLLIFSVPQGYLGWGGTPTLIGMTAGFVLLGFLRLSRNGKVEPYVYGLYAMALCYAAHGHPIGFYVSMAVSGPVFIFEAFPNGKVHFRRGFFLLCAFALFFSPYFIYFGMNASSADLKFARDWQVLMAPLLFRPENSLAYNLYSQITSYLWNTSAVFALVASIAAMFNRSARSRFGVSFLIFVVIVVALVANVYRWVLPLSFLLYPERCGTFLLVPLAMGIAWLFEQTERAAPFAKVVLTLVLLTFSAIQFHHRLYPMLFHSKVTAEDREAFRRIAQVVPPHECIHVDQSEAGQWISVLSFRCTVPFHGLGMNTLDAEKKLQRPSPWSYLPNSRKDVKLEKGVVVFNNGARLVKLDEPSTQQAPFLENSR